MQMCCFSCYRTPQCLRSSCYPAGWAALRSGSVAAPTSGPVFSCSCSPPAQQCSSSLCSGWSLPWQQFDPSFVCWAASGPSCSLSAGPYVVSETGLWHAVTTNTNGCSNSNLKMDHFTTVCLAPLCSCYLHQYQRPLRAYPTRPCLRHHW